MSGPPLPSDRSRIRLRSPCPRLVNAVVGQHCLSTLHVQITRTRPRLEVLGRESGEVGEREQVGASLDFVGEDLR